ncbi:hypothetical protein TRVA0_004S02036 [Trichomonascus vanleenenianus]|uniref:mitochondrial 54S ribosomal protein mL49 IMG2 n=1 Tax=Trichomonascus vanleenenianus TaxID=2268995 RepID=UPI003EC9B0A5
MLRLARPILRPVNGVRYFASSAPRLSLDPRQNTTADKFPSLDEIDASSLVLQKADAGAWYNVKRTKSGKLPVYRDIKVSDGNIHTVIRNVEGNAEQLRQDLQKHLVIDKSKIVVKKTSNKVVIKFDCANFIRSVLGQKF